jgi:DNA-binding XRE family transcriptional regulator
MKILKQVKRILKHFIHFDLILGEKCLYFFQHFVTFSTRTIMAIDDKAFDKRFFSAYVGRKLGVIREEKQMTLAELATKTGASYHGNITNIINGRVSASIEQLWKMAEALGLSQKEFDGQRS